MNSPNGHDDQTGRRGEWSFDDHLNPAAPDRGRRNWWRPIAIVLTVVLLTGGLFVLGAIAILWIGMANYGSNK